MTQWIHNYTGTSVVPRAYLFAKEAHKDTKRESGEPYIIHSVRVAETIHKWHLDESSIAAALLHDVVEDTRFTIKDIQKNFGDEIAFLVNGLTKLENIPYSQENPDVENLRKLIISFSKDLRVLIIKLADRLHNMQTLAALPPERQKRISQETEDIYAPLAYRLGMQRLSGELEDLSFPYTHPEAYDWLLKSIKEPYAERIKYLKRIKPIVEKALRDGGLQPILIDTRAKRYASLYKKLMRYDMELEKIYDLAALRIIVKTVEDCYAALGLIHKLWTPLPNKIKDYIARPKPNGYRSIHTTVSCVDNKITEFQIRTQEMHDEAELGIAAHWAYDQIKSSKEHAAKWKGVTSRKELVWVEQLQNWQKAFTNRKDFLDALKVDFFKDRIFVMTPHNDVIDLPSGATPIDFAYRIHSDLGDQCVGAKVNNKLVPLDYILNSGDIVEVVTQKGKKPSKDWLRFVKTSFAKKQIRSILQERNKKLEKHVENPHMDFKIVNHDRSGYLKDVTAAFGDLKINITHLTSTTDTRSLFSTVKIETEILPKEKLEKLLVKLKKITGTEEVNYKFNR